jgi:hypothetical protein
MKTYDEIKSEMVSIAEILKKYSENIQPQVFDILTNHFLGDSQLQRQSENAKKSNTSKEVKVEKSKTKSNSKGGSKGGNDVTLLKDLDLRAKGKKSFKEFYDEKNPGPASEFNTVAVYYLSDTLQLPSITPSHIYTCYKEVTKRPPEAFVQSLRDTASRNGYIDIGDLNNIKIPLRGRNFVDHDLPRQKAKK